MNGDKETGVTIFQISEKVDTGDILAQEKYPIYDDDNMLTSRNKAMQFRCRHNS